MEHRGVGGRGVAREYRLDDVPCSACERGRRPSVRNCARRNGASRRRKPREIGDDLVVRAEINLGVQATLAAA